METTIPGRKRCPITRRNTDDCTDEVFRNDCAAFRKTIEMKTGIVLNYCSVRPGHPQAMVKSENIQESEVKEMVAIVDGKCDLCVLKKRVRKVRGKNCCPTCEHVWRAANVSPGLLAKALLETKDAVWLAEHFGFEATAATSADSTAADLQAAQNEIEQLKLALADVRSIREQIEKLRLEKKMDQIEIERLTNLGGALISFQNKVFETLKVDHLAPVDIAVSAAVLEIEGIQNEVSHLREKVNALEIEKSYGWPSWSEMIKPVPAVLCSSDPSKADLLLDIALGVIKGTVQGVTADQLHALKAA